MTFSTSRYFSMMPFLKVSKLQKKAIIIIIIIIIILILILIIIIINYFVRVTLQDFIKRSCSQAN